MPNKNGKPGVGNTFNPIRLDAQAGAAQTFDEFVKSLLAKLDSLRQERFDYYEKLRSGNSHWANGARQCLALLGATAFLLTAVATAMRFIRGPLAHSDRWILLTVLAVYAVMATIAFYEKGTDKTATYFRQLGVLLSMRDLWTKFQFDVLKELTAFRAKPDTNAEADTRERIRALADTFCTNLDKITTEELGAWRTAFLASLTAMEAAAKTGTDDIEKKLEDIRKRTETAATEAKAAAKVAEDAAQLGALNVTLSGAWDDDVAVSIDGKEVARTRHKTVAIDRVAPGPRKFSLSWKKDGKELGMSRMVDVRPGLHDLPLQLE